jgi:hypothetical protein
LLSILAPEVYCLKSSGAKEIDNFSLPDSPQLLETSSSSSFILFERSYMFREPGLFRMLYFLFKMVLIVKRRERTFPTFVDFADLVALDKVSNASYI